MHTRGRVGGGVESRTLGRAGITAAALGAGFLVLAVLVAAAWAPLVRLDGQLAVGLHRWALADPALVTGLAWVSTVLAPWPWRGAVLVLAVVLALRGQRRLGGWALATMLGAGLLGALAKLAVGRVRPVLPDPVATATGLSFPSGHALNSAVGALLVVLVTGRRLGTAGRVAAGLLAGLLVLAVGVSRIGLGVHYLSDVLGGWLLAGAWVAAAWCAAALLGGPTWYAGDPGPAPRLRER